MHKPVAGLSRSRQLLGWLGEAIGSLQPNTVKQPRPTNQGFSSGTAGVSVIAALPNEKSVMWLWQLQARSPRQRRGGEEGWGHPWSPAGSLPSHGQGCRGANIPESPQKEG